MDDHCPLTLRRPSEIEMEREPLFSTVDFVALGLGFYRMTRNLAKASATCAIFALIATPAFCQLAEPNFPPAPPEQHGNMFSAIGHNFMEGWRKAREHQQLAYEAEKQARDARRNRLDTLLVWANQLEAMPEGEEKAVLRSRWLALYAEDQRLQELESQKAGARVLGQTGANGTTVYSPSECIGPIINGVCHGSILPNSAYHPTCHGEMINGMCTGPMF